MKEDHLLSGKVSHFPKPSALLERKIEQSEGKKSVASDKKGGLLSTCRVQCVQETDPLHGT